MTKFKLMKHTITHDFEPDKPRECTCTLNVGSCFCEKEN